MSQEYAKSFIGIIHLILNFSFPLQSSEQDIIY